MTDSETEPAAEMIRSAVVPDPTTETDPVAEAKAAASPVPVPPLSHYAALWQHSMFTTHDLPAPDLPQGPGFADQLVLAGIYEVDGAVVAVILDKMTAQISEARIGSDNEQGIRIKSVNPGEAADMTRIQLQKGMQSGWIQFAETGGPAPAGEGSAIPGMNPQQSVLETMPGMTPAPVINTPVLAPLPGNFNSGAANPNPRLDDLPLPPE